MILLPVCSKTCTIFWKYCGLFSCSVGLFSCSVGSALPFAFRFLYYIVAKIK
ncbi:hypothetical protein RchiOBHm_Chr3g0487441 [Rosa chinensis]|uniref:Uncharacterized protein n=1 Tax=Rosa chinensis TaxID=74649 RepID=A0A2P6RFJ5_ROSCH|nr:hypothetical protein RchiOBHm_Chr3g0487441 [Rosa chinensis]